MSNYTLNYSGGSITVYDNSLNEDTSLSLPGRNYSGYGSPVDQDLVDLLENFASSATSPDNAIKGQLWFQPGVNNNFLNYNTSDTKGVPSWVKVVGTDIGMDVSFGSVTFSPLGASPATPVAGQTYYDLDKNKISYWNGSEWVDLPGAAADYEIYGPGVAIGSTTQPDQVNWFTGNTNQMLLWANQYYSGLNRYSSNGYAGALEFDKTTGDWAFSNAISGVGNLAVANTQRVVIKNNGRVGIGTNTPTSILDVVDTSVSGNAYINVRTGGPAVLSLGSGNAFSAGGAGSVFTTESYPLIFGTQSTQRMMIDASGNVGINVTPTKTPAVAGTFKVSGSVTLNGQTYTFPSSAGTNGYALVTNGTGTLSWAAQGTGALPAENLVGAIPGTVTAVTQPAGNNTTKIATTAFVQAALSALYPLGSIYINATNSTNPGTLLGFGTWDAFGAGNVPVGYDSSNSRFNAGEKTGGSANSIVVSHNHTATTTVSGGAHTHTGFTSTIGNHQHYVASNNDSDTSVTDLPNSPIGYLKTPGGDSEYRLTATSGATAVAGLTSAAGSHSHSFTTSSTTPAASGSTTISSTGSSGTGENYQPYITVFMWKRIA